MSLAQEDFKRLSRSSNSKLARKEWEPSLTRTKWIRCSVQNQLSPSILILKLSLIEAIFISNDLN